MKSQGSRSKWVRLPSHIPGNHEIGIQMKRTELTKTSMVILTRKHSLVSMVYTKIFQRFKDSVKETMFIYEKGRIWKNDMWQHWIDVRCLPGIRKYLSRSHDVCCTVPADYDTVICRGVTLRQGGNAPPEGEDGGGTEIFVCVKK